MTEIFNKYPQRERRKKLRAEATPAEMKLWKRLSRRKMSGLKFRRQYGVGTFILDFYCPELNLAIEIDGEYHNEEEIKENDQARQEQIEALGIRFLRFTNDVILTD